MEPYLIKRFSQKNAKAKFSIMERIKQIVEKKLRSKNSRSKSQLKIARFKLR